MSATTTRDVKTPVATQYTLGKGVRQRNNASESEPDTPHYFVRPFREGGASLGWVRSFGREVAWLCRQREAQQTLALVVLNLLATLLLLSWCHATRSMALMAYTYLSWFSLLSLISCLVCVWAESQMANSCYTFGYLRCEALSVFASVTLSLLGAVIIVKECVERVLEPEQVHTGMLSVGGLVGLVLHVSMTTLAHNRPLTEVLKASQSSLLQEHVADMCQSLCGYVPALARVLLPRVNPVVLISLAGFLAILADHMVLQIYNYQAADSIAALVIAVLTITTMVPLCLCSGRILLQTTPESVFGQVDKCLREALTLDGVLEFRHENIWTLGLGRHAATPPQGTAEMYGGFVLTGSLHVRIRRDANEQMVLAHVRERLQPLVPLLTVQVFKDDWTRSSTTLQLLNDSSRALAGSPTSHFPTTSTHYPHVSHYLTTPHHPSTPHHYHTANTNSPNPTTTPHHPVDSPHYVNVTYSHSIPVKNDPSSLRSSTSTLTSSITPNAPGFHFSNASSTPNQAHLTNRTIPSKSVLNAPSKHVAYSSASEQLFSDEDGEESEAGYYGAGHKPSPYYVNIEQKPTPYYVNVDFLSRSNALSDAGLATPGCKSSNSSVVNDSR